MGTKSNSYKAVSLLRLEEKRYNRWYFQFNTSKKDSDCENKIEHDCQGNLKEGIVQRVLCTVDIDMYFNHTTLKKTSKTHTHTQKTGRKWLTALLCL